MRHVYANGTIANTSLPHTRKVPVILIIGFRATSQTVGNSDVTAAIRNRS